MYFCVCLYLCVYFCASKNACVLYMYLFICVNPVWNQVLSELDIVVPLQLLISMFSDGVNSVKELANQKKARVSDLTGNTGARRVRETDMPNLLPSNRTTVLIILSVLPKELQRSEFFTLTFLSLSVEP